MHEVDSLYVFCAFFKRQNAWGVRNSWKEKKKNESEMQFSSHEGIISFGKVPEKQKCVQGFRKEIFERQCKEQQTHVYEKPTRSYFLKKRFLSYTLFTGAWRARLSGGPLYLCVLWLEIMHNGVLVKEVKIEEEDEVQKSKRRQRTAREFINSCFNPFLQSLLITE